MNNDTKRAILYAGWVVANFLGVGLLVFAHPLVLRIVGWLWVAFAISLSGLFAIGLISHERFTKPKQ